MDDNKELNEKKPEQLKDEELKDASGGVQDTYIKAFGRCKDYGKSFSCVHLCKYWGTPECIEGYPQRADVSYEPNELMDIFG